MKINFTKAAALAAAVIMAQSMAMGAYAETVQTGSLTAIELSASTDQKSKYNDNKGYTALDKWGNAYPYSYYYYAEKSLEKGSEYLIEDYIAIYNYLHEHRGVDEGEYLYFKMKRNCATRSEDTRTYGSMLRQMLGDTPTLYYYSTSVFGCETNPKDDSYVIIHIKLRHTKEQIAEYDKKLEKVKKDFKNLLNQNNPKNAKDFYKAVISYIDANVNDGSSADNDNIVGSLINNFANCAGHVSAFNYLSAVNQMPYASSAGYVRGNNPHGWSKVPIGNVWYVVDPTFSGDLVFISDDDYVTLNTAKENTISSVYPAANGQKIIPSLPSKIPTVSTKDLDITYDNFIGMRSGWKTNHSKYWGFGEGWISKDIKKATEMGYGCVYAKIEDSDTKSKEDKLAEVKSQLAKFKKEKTAIFDHYKIVDNVVYIYMTKETFDVSGKAAASSTANAKKNISVKIKSDSLKTYKAFKKALKSAVKKAQDGGYGYLTLKNSDTATLEKFLKQAKEDGVISYSSLKTSKDGIRIKF